MSEVDFSAALNAEPGIDPPRSAEIGETFADALRLMKRAKYVGLAVSHGTGSGHEDWSYVRVPRAAVLRWLNFNSPTKALHSRLTPQFDEELWLFVGSPHDHATPAGVPS